MFSVSHIVIYCMVRFWIIKFYDHLCQCNQIPCSAPGIEGGRPWGWNQSNQKSCPQLKQCHDDDFDWKKYHESSVWSVHYCTKWSNNYDIKKTLKFTKLNQKLKRNQNVFVKR